MIRKVLKQDIPHLKSVLNSIDLFPADMLADMISDYFNNKNTNDIWFTFVEDDIPKSIAFCGPEQLTNGTYNLFAIGVKADQQGRGLGTKMMNYLEKQLKDLGHRILIVETSSSDDFKLTRKFYENIGYRKEAVISDFWEEGDDKVIYWKKLN